MFDKTKCLTEFTLKKGSSNFNKNSESPLKKKWYNKSTNLMIWF